MRIYELILEQGGKIHPETIYVPAASQEDAVRAGASHAGLAQKAYHYAVIETCFRARSGEGIATYPR